MNARSIRVEQTFFIKKTLFVENKYQLAVLYVRFVL